MKNSLLSSRLIFLLFLFLGIITYYKAIYSDFYYDDLIRIARIATVDDKVVFYPLPAYEAGLFSAINSILPDRPILMATIWLNYLVGAGNPMGYKLVNIFLHIINAFLLFELLRFAARKISPNKEKLLPLSLSLIFLTHPLNNQAVTMVIQRGVLLSFLMAALTIIASIYFIKTNRREYAFAAILFFALGVFSKSNILILPIILLATSRALRLPKKAMHLFGALLLVGMLPGIFYFLLRVNFHAQSTEAANWLHYGLAQSRVVFHYLSQVVFPWGFNISYPIQTSIIHWDGITQLACLAHLAIISFSLFLWWKKSLVGTALFCFYLSLIPESSFFPIPHVVFDHRMYLPFAFLLFFLFFSLRKINEKITFPVFTVIVLLLVPLNYARNEEIQDYRKWATSSALKYKNDPEGNLGYLDLLSSISSREEGLNASRLFSSLHPQIPDYKIFELIFADNLDGLMNQPELIKAPFSRPQITQPAIARYITHWQNQIDTNSDPEQGPQIQALEFYYIYLMRINADAYVDLIRKLEIKIHLIYLKLERKGLIFPHQRELWIKIIADLGENAENEAPDLIKYFLWLDKNN